MFKLKMAPLSVLMLTDVAPVPSKPSCCFSILNELTRFMAHPNLIWNWKAGCSYPTSSRLRSQDPPRSHRLCLITQFAPAWQWRGCNIQSAKSHVSQKSWRSTHRRCSCAAVSLLTLQWHCCRRPLSSLAFKDRLQLNLRVSAETQRVSLSHNMLN